MRIGMMCHASFGGSARIGIELAMALAQREHCIHLVTHTTPYGYCHHDRRWAPRRRWRRRTGHGSRARAAPRLWDRPAGTSLYRGRYQPPGTHGPDEITRLPHMWRSCCLKLTHPSHPGSSLVIAPGLTQASTSIDLAQSGAKLLYEIDSTSSNSMLDGRMSRGGTR